jgi:hypothetical protein
LRRRLAAVLVALSAAVTVVTISPVAGATARAPHRGHVVVAQSPAPQGSPGAAPPETPWTYQMAKVSIGLLILGALAGGAVYYRLVAKPKRDAS